jgi:lysophospholipase L1-like esterase
VVGPDGIHPNAAAHEVIAQSLLAILRPLSVSLREWRVNYA